MRRATLRRGITAVLASAAVVGSVVAFGGAAFAATTTVYNGSADYIDVSIAFNSTQSPQATVSGVGYDTAADGYGPYLRVVFNYSNGTNSGPRISSCAAGAGGHCTIPTVYSSTSTVSSVTLNACSGAGGQIHACGPQKTISR